MDVVIPPGWTANPLDPPDLASTPQVHVLSWRAWTAASGASPGPAFLVEACFAGETRAWTPEAEPMVLERLDAVVSSTALRVARVGGGRVAARDHAGGLTSERIEGAGDAEGLLLARTFLGFVGTTDPSRSASSPAAPSVVGCFVLCTSDLAACGPSVEHATVTCRFVEPPLPTLGVRAMVAMAHHPSVTVVSALALSLVAAIVAVATRRRPQRK